jgi:hypothetical protein
MTVTDDGATVTKSGEEKLAAALVEMTAQNERVGYYRSLPTSEDIRQTLKYCESIMLDRQVRAFALKLGGDHRIYKTRDGNLVSFIDDETQILFDLWREH